MGSQSDYPVMRDCEKILKTLKIKYQVLIVSAHRTPKRLYDFSQTAEKNGFAVVVAGAGGSDSFSWYGGITNNITCFRGPYRN